MINTIDPEFFIENIRFGYEQRKNRHADKSDSAIEIVPEILNLLKSSN